MSLSVSCGSCDAIFRVKAEHIGKRGKCPRCQNIILVSGNVPAEPVIPVETSKLIPEESPADDLASPPEERSQEDELPKVYRLSIGESQEVQMREILQAFHGEIQPVKRTAGFHIGMMILAGLMVLMPLIYLGMIVGIGYLLFYHATVNLESVTRSHSILALIFLYVAPLIAGVVLLFFMVKPLFASRSRSQKLRTLEFGQEPLLFALVTRIAKAVGAPEPTRINVDCQPNASAGFGSGLGGIFGKDLVLTIGLPLVAGLSIQQLAGVIAHELGHFAQGTAMRLSYIVRSVNLWFARVVYERDDWDESLARGCEAENRFALVLMLAMFCIWLTRCILWVFMVMTHALSSFVLRQMEYDADRYEARLAGSKTFAKTQRRLLLLGLATNGANFVAARSWFLTGKLPDDLSSLILGISEGISKKEFRKIEKQEEKTTTGFFDSHPAHAERLANARKENAEGLFRLEGPATELFREFPKMSRAVTLDFYREVLGRRVKKDKLVPTAAFLENTEHPME